MNLQLHALSATMKDKALNRYKISNLFLKNDDLLIYSHPIYLYIYKSKKMYSLWRLIGTLYVV